MADVAMWQDSEYRANFEAKGKLRLEELKTELEGRQGVVAIDPETGDYFVGATLGKANAAAFQEFPDHWFYFARLDDFDAAMPLPTW